MKKIASLVLAAVMLFAVYIPSFAEESSDYSIADERETTSQATESTDSSSFIRTSDPVLDAVENPLTHMSPTLHDEPFGADVGEPTPPPTPPHPRPYPYISSILSSGAIWICVGIVAVAAGVFAVILVRKKKKPAVAGGGESDE